MVSLLLNILCLSHIKSYSQWSSQLCSGATDGPPNRLNFVRIIWLWLALVVVGHVEGSYHDGSSLPPSLPLLPLIQLVEIILLLMPYLILVSSVSVV